MSWTVKLKNVEKVGRNVSAEIELTCSENNLVIVEKIHANDLTSERIAKFAGSVIKSLEAQNTCHTDLQALVGTEIQPIYPDETTI